MFKKILYSIILFTCFLQSCDESIEKPSNSVIFKDDSLLMYFKSGKKISFVSPEIYHDNNKPIYCIDTIGDLLYVLPTKHSILSYKFSTGDFVKAVDILNEKNELNIKLYLFEDFLIFESNSQIKVFNKNLDMKSSLFDSLYHYKPLCNCIIKEHKLNLFKDSLGLNVTYNNFKNDSIINKTFLFISENKKIKLFGNHSNCVYYTLPEIDR